MNKQVILTGIRANNDLHIGNYFGALLPMIDMAKKHSDEYEINLFVPDLHSFTTPIDHSKLQAQIMHNLKIFVAAGLPLDNDSIHIYRQSYIPAHSELTWILDCFTGFGEMSRMTQFKDKSSVSDKEVREVFEDILKKRYPNLHEAIHEAEDEEYEEKFHDKIFDVYRLVDEVVREQKRDKSTVGLFNYPVLMASDILLYGAKYVPVGDDQTQHLEFTRDIATRMNNQFGDLFVIPEPVAKQHEFFGKDQGLRIKDLADPTKKMSKSDESGRGIIFLGDNPEDAAKKIMSATTDSLGTVHYDVNEQPGISNLLQIHALLSGETLQAVIDHHDGQESYGDLKKEVAEQIKEFLVNFQTKLANVDEQAILSKLESDEKQMSEVAGKTLYKVQKAVGLRP
ncbi:MAG TPA: tryptophan--tRNA ligase [Candidatus Saccharimonadales bacterium]|nr:tryptophan--tRNA ligase [Candidatus Saccharimonadales bacterium]